MIKEYKETHIKGLMSMEKTFPTNYKLCDFGIQIAKDGRVWICIDGEAFIRFKPMGQQEWEEINNADNKRMSGE